MAKIDFSLFDISAFDNRLKRKYQSAEAHKSQENAPPCDRVGCQELGHYKASRSPRLLSEYRYFCIEHIREYNKKWNFCADMSEEEIIRHIELDMIGHRPTWQSGSSTKKNKEFSHSQKNQKKFIFDDPFNLADKLFDFHQESQSNADAHTCPPTIIPSGELKKLQKACQVLNIKFPPKSHEAKQNYKILVKKYHPDINKDDADAADKTKDIVESYKLIETFLRN